jgi:hypothetical protein
MERKLSTVKISDRLGLFIYLTDCAIFARSSVVTFSSEVGQLLFSLLLLLKRTKLMQDVACCNFCIESNYLIILVKYYMIWIRISKVAIDIDVRFQWHGDLYSPVSLSSWFEHCYQAQGTTLSPSLQYTNFKFEKGTYSKVQKTQQYIINVG